MKTTQNLFFLMMIWLIFTGCLLIKIPESPATPKPVNISTPTPPIPTTIPTPISTNPAYYYAAFGSNTDQKLYIYSSSDGQDYSLWADTGYTDPITGVLRDPGLIYLNGMYYIAYTVKNFSKNSTSFSIASSSNMRDWTYLTSVDCGITDATYTWAPDWYVEDNTVDLIVSISTIDISHFKPYIFTALDSTMTSWSDPVDMNIGLNHIDAFVVKENNTYHCFTVNGSGSPSPYIEHYTASSLTGPWTLINAPFSVHREGPSLIKMNNGTWRIFFDPYQSTGNILKTATSTDLTNWTAETSTGMNAYHGSCIYH